MGMLGDPEECWGGCGPGNWGALRWKRDRVTQGDRGTGRLQGKQDKGGCGGTRETGGNQQHQVGTKGTGRESGDQRRRPVLTAPLPTGSASTPGCPRTWWAHTHPEHTAWSPCP